MTDQHSAVGALHGLRVVDFGQYLVAPMLAMFLADNGADVIHIDPPSGPRWRDPTNAALYRNKRAIELDLKSAAGLAKARELIGTADIVIENFRPGVMDGLGLDYAGLAAANPRLIWCAMPAFAADDPRSAMPGWEGVVTAAAGLYPPPNFMAGDPVFSAVPLVSNITAFLASHRVMAAVLMRCRTGKGRRLEISMFEGCFQAIGMYAEAPMSRDLASTLFMKFLAILRQRRAADGTYLFFDTPVRGIQALVDRYLPGNDLLALDDEALKRLGVELDELIAQKSGREWERIGQEQVKGSFAVSMTSEEWLADPHARESGTVVEVTDAELGPTVQPGWPVVLTRTPASIRWGRGMAGEQDAAQITWQNEPWVDPAVPAGQSGLALDGIRVVDCSTLLAGPTTGRVLTQYGAEVIKLDRAGVATGDVDPMTDDEAALVSGRTINSGKRMFFLDLKRADGQEIMRELVRNSDIVHHNFTPATAERLCVTGEQMRAINPAIIASNMSLHSWGGSRAAYRGHDMLAQMNTGMTARMGGDGPATLMTTYLNDNAAGHLHAFGIFLALLHRYRTGEAQDVNQSLSRTATLHQVPFMVTYAGKVWDEPTGREAKGWHALNRLYRCEDGWIYLAGRHDERSRLAKCPLLDGVAAVSDDQLEHWLEERLSKVPVEEAVTQLTAAGLGAHRHIALADLVTDEYVRDHRLVAVHDHPGVGPALGIGLHLYGDADLRDLPCLVARRPGVDTFDILEELGFGDRIVQLLRDGVVAIGESRLYATTRARGYWARVQRGNQMGGLALSEKLQNDIVNSPPAPAAPVQLRSPAAGGGEPRMP